MEIAGKGTHPADKLHLRLMGTPQILLAGEEIVLRERKAIALLAYLVLEQGVQSRDTLAALFWPEYDQKRARANLRYLLWRMRQSVGEAWLRTDGDQVALNSVGRIHVDVAEFRRHVTAWRAHTHQAGEYCAACTDSLKAATQLNRGDFLQGFTLEDSAQFDDWQFFQAEGLRRELAAVIEALVEQEIARQGYEEAIDYARRWLAMDPLHEPASRALMKLYAWSGQLEAAIRQFHHCAQSLQEEIGVEPDEETQQLYAQIRNRRFPLGLPHKGKNVPSPEPMPREAATPGNLPSAPATFVGRQSQLEQISQRLADASVQLLTIVGPGGIGKTALALQAGRLAQSNFPDGVWFVSLAGLSSSAQVALTLFGVLQVPADSGSPAHQQLFAHLRHKQKLLILDNFEDVLSAAEFVAELLHKCPKVKLIVTSRERLNLRNEWLLILGSLTYPDSPANAGKDAASWAHYSALRFFEICAQRTQPAFSLDRTSLSPVIRICQLVDGMPLALEMAAAWTRVLPVAEIPIEIERSLAFLAASARDVVERHRSIHAVFDYSWERLTDRERSVLRQLSVFRNGFTREGVAAVAGATLLDLSALLDKSWLQLDNRSRYQMHALAQKYAQEKLQTERAVLPSETIDDLLRRHCQFYASLTASISEFTDVRSAILLAEVENVKLAWQTALHQRDWQALGQLIHPIKTLVYSSINPDINQQLEQAITGIDEELSPSPREAKADRDRLEVVLATLLTVGSFAHIHLGNAGKSIQWALRSRDLLRDHRYRNRELDLLYAGVLSRLGFAFYYIGQYDEAEQVYIEALAEHKRLHDETQITEVATSLALLYDRIGDYDSAEASLQSVLSSAQQASIWHLVAQATLGRVWMNQGRYREARQILEDNLVRATYRLQGHILISLGSIARREGRPGEALEFLQRGLAIADEIGDRPSRSDLLAELGFTQLQLGEVPLAQQLFNQSLAVAQEIGRLRTVTLALTGLGQAALMQRQRQRAQHTLGRALAVATQVHAPPELLTILATLAELHITEGRRESAIALLQLVCRHPATNYEIRSRAQSRLQDLTSVETTSKAELPKDAANVALAQAVRTTQAELQPVSPVDPDEREG